MQPTQTLTPECEPDQAMIPLWALDFELSGAELRVYVALRSLADRAGKCTVGSKAIAELARVDQGTARNAVAKLRQFELLLTTPAYHPDGGMAGLNFVLANTDPRAPEARKPIGAKMWSETRRERYDLVWAGQIRTGGDIPDRIRMIVLERDGYRCVRCDSADDLTIDHIYPRSRGGRHTAENLQVLCRSCNGRKGAKVEP